MKTAFSGFSNFGSCDFQDYPDFETLISGDPERIFQICKMCQILESVSYRTEVISEKLEFVCPQICDLQKAVRVHFCIL